VEVTEMSSPVEPVRVPPKVRTFLYIVTLVAGAAATAATAITATLWPEAAVTVAAIGGAVTGLLATVCGGLGVAYRPTVNPGPAEVEPAVSWPLD
jgi:hypothetical protein